MSKKQRWIIIGLVFIAAGLRLYNLGGAAFWYDEAFTDLATDGSLDQLYQALAGDVHPPLYYLFIWAVQQLGIQSFAGLRMISVVASTASVILVGQLAYRLTDDRWIQIMAMGMMAFSPMSLRYAQEARMYALLELVIVAGLLAIVERQRAILTIATASAMLLHNYGLFYALALFLVALARSGWKWREWIAPFAISGLLWLPWGIQMAMQMMHLSSAGYWIQPLSVGRVIRSIYKIIYAFAVPLELYIGTMLMLAIGLVVMVVELWRDREHHEQWAPLVGVILITLTLVVVVSMAYRPILLYRPLIGILPALAILAAIVIDRQPRSGQILAAAVIIPALLGLTFGYHYFNPQNKADARSWIREIRAGWQVGDVVYTLNDSGAMALLEYAPELPVYKMPDCPDQASLGALTSQTRDALGIVEKPQDQLTGRVWVVVSSSPVSPACELSTAQSMAANGERVKRIHKNDFVDAGLYLREYGQ